MILRNTRLVAPLLKRMAGQAQVHDVAAKGFAAGTNELYDRARPSYPASALTFIHDAIKPSGATIIEPGSGTGIFSRLLLHPPTTDYPRFDLKTLVGVEPSEGMRQTWDKSMARLPESVLAGINVRCVDGGFDDFSKTKLPKGSADAVIIAQAWHWCPDHEAALTEIASYLKPGAPLVLIWNLESDKDGWHKALRETYEPHDLGSPQYYRMLWRAMFDTKAYEQLYIPAEENTFPWEMGMNEDQVVERIMSKSYMTMLGDKKEAAEKQIRKVVQEGDKEWIDQEKGTFKYRYNTDIVLLHKR